MKIEVGEVITSLSRVNVGNWVVGGESGLVCEYGCGGGWWSGWDVISFVIGLDSLEKICGKTD